MTYGLKVRDRVAYEHDGQTYTGTIVETISETDPGYRGIEIVEIHLDKTGSLRSPTWVLVEKCGLRRIMGALS